MAGDHDSVTNLATAVRNATLLLANGPRGLLQAFAAESYVQRIPSNSHPLYEDQHGPVCYHTPSRLHCFLVREKDVTSRLEAVKSFPQDLLPCHFTTAPLQKDALTLVLGANKGGIIIHGLIEDSIVDSLWTFRHGEALADAIGLWVWLHFSTRVTKLYCINWGDFPL